MYHSQGAEMIRKPLSVTFRLDEDTRAKVLGRIGPNHRLRTFSAFIREGIELRLAQSDPYLGWSIAR
jgi:hypothetical protein